jgi:tagatose-1,6-bisphosphate aldolase
MHLSALQSDQGMFSILEFDVGYQLADLLGLDVNVTGGIDQFNLVFRDLITHLANRPAAVAADSTYSLPLLLGDIEKGLILRLDQVVKKTPLETVPQLAANWGVDEIANNYGIAKLELWYHPAEEKSLDKKRMVAELYEYCQHEGIDLLLKLNIYTLPDESKEQVVFQETQLRAIQELRSSCHLLSIQYPGDALAAATITAEADQPWIISLSSQDYEQNKQHLRTVLENGAKGFAIGDGLWHEMGSLRQADESPDLSAIQTFIETTVRDRMIELVRITNELSPK